MALVKLREDCLVKLKLLVVERALVLKGSEDGRSYTYRGSHVTYDPPRAKRLPPPTNKSEKKSPTIHTPNHSVRIYKTTSSGQPRLRKTFKTVL